MAQRNGWSEHDVCEYRGLLDEEESAFDELEHAIEEGDSSLFDKALTRLKKATEKKLRYLESKGLLAANGSGR